MSGRLTTIQREVMSQIRLSWAFGLALYFSFLLTTFLFLSSIYYYYLEKCIGGLRVVGNGCVSSKGLVDWMLYFIFFTYFSVRVFFFAYERAYGVCKIKGDIGFLFLKTNVLLAEYYRYVGTLYD